MVAQLMDEKEKKKKRPPQRGILTKIAFAMGAPLLFGVLVIVTFVYGYSSKVTLLMNRNDGIAWNSGAVLLPYAIVLALFCLVCLLYYRFTIRYSRWFIVPFVVHIAVTALAVSSVFRTLQNPRVIMATVTMLDGEYQLVRDEEVYNFDPEVENYMDFNFILDVIRINKCSSLEDECEQVWLGVATLPTKHLHKWIGEPLNMVASPDHKNALRITSDSGICFDLDTHSFPRHHPTTFASTTPSDCAIILYQ